MAEIALKITTNFSKAEKEIHALGAVTDAEAKRFAKYNAAFTPDNIEKWTQSNRRAVAAIEATQGPLKAAAANQRNLERKIQGAIRNGINPEDERLQRLRAELVKASERTEALTNEQKAMGRSMDTAANRTEKLTKSQASLGKVARAAAIGIAALAAAVGLGAKKAVGAFVDYREAIANVNTLVPISAGEFENLDGKLKQVSEELGIQKKELAGGVYQAISASVEGYKDLAGALEITEQAAKLATGANTTNAQSVDIITTAMSAYGPTVVDASKASDVFFQIIKSGKIDGEQLSSVIGQAIS